MPVSNIKQRAVSVVTVEVDGAWRKPKKQELGDLDKLIEFAHKQGYMTYVKIPCTKFIDS